MNREYQKMWEVQQEMLGQWLSFYKKLFPSFEEKTSRAAGKKDQKASTVSPTEWPKAMTDFYQHWMQDQEEVARKWWKAFGEMSGAPAPYFSGFGFSKAQEESAKFWKTWAEQANKLWPFVGQAKAGQGKLPFLEAYSNWLSGFYQFWKPWASQMEAMGYEPKFIDKYFSGQAFREAVEKFPGFMPGETWTSFLNKSHQGFDKYIEFLNDIDLPFDEMAAFWDKMLVRLTPLDEVPLFRLGNNIHHYLEILANPFYAIAGTPKIMRTQKVLRDIQFNYLSFVLKNAELRGKLLESSMAVLPETIRTYMDDYETQGKVPVGVEFFQHYIDNLDKHLKVLLASDDYTHIQNEVARVGVTLKSKIDELIELSVEGLPLLTKSDEDDIAREIEALRVKLRELGDKQKKDLSKTALKKEALN
ncbi:MAG: hypothetical protein H6559_10820 [Lewinellaceae bacterium]|nr:hypothetical protein [Lewinellaceae bacterium]